MNYKILNNKIFVYIFFTILSFFVRYYLFEGKESWHDEWHSIYVANPSITNAETLIRYYGDKGEQFLTEYYPPLYLFILKYIFLFFGYIDDNGRWLSLVAGTLTLPLIIYLANIFLDIKKTFFSGIVITFNLFLIWQSLEIRAHSILVLTSILNIILFYKLIDKKKYTYFIIYALSSIFLLSLWPISGVIFFGKTIFLIKKLIIEKVFEKKIFILFTLILLTYLILNFDYLKLNLSRDFHYTTLYSTFFYNYHFRTFFGSPVLGGVYLIIFAALLICNTKKIVFLNSKENLIIYIILSSYFLTLLYTFFRASIMSPKYVIFIVPLIIVWINIELFKYKNAKFISTILILTTIVFCILKIESWPIKRPPTTEALKIIKDDKSTNIFSLDGDVFNTYLTTKRIFVENNFVLLNKKLIIPNSINNFWFICLNNPSFAVGDEKRPDQEICKNFQANNSNFLETKEIKIKDFILKKFENNNIN